MRGLADKLDSEVIDFDLSHAINLLHFYMINEPTSTLKALISTGLLIKLMDLLVHPRVKDFFIELLQINGTGVIIPAQMKNKLYAYCCISNFSRVLCDKLLGKPMTEISPPAQKISLLDQSIVYVNKITNFSNVHFNSLDRRYHLMPEDVFILPDIDLIRGFSGQESSTKLSNSPKKIIKKMSRFLSQEQLPRVLNFTAPAVKPVFLFKNRRSGSEFHPIDWFSRSKHIFDKNYYVEENYLKLSNCFSSELLIEKEREAVLVAEVFYYLFKPTIESHLSSIVSVTPVVSKDLFEEFYKMFFYKQTNCFFESILLCYLSKINRLSILGNRGNSSATYCGQLINLLLSKSVLYSRHKIVSEEIQATIMRQMKLFNYIFIESFRVYSLSPDKLKTGPRLLISSVILTSQFFGFSTRFLESISPFTNKIIFYYFCEFINDDQLTRDILDYFSKFFNIGSEKTTIRTLISADLLRDLRSSLVAYARKAFLTNKEKMLQDVGTRRILALSEIVINLKGNPEHKALDLHFEHSNSFESISTLRNMLKENSPDLLTFLLQLPIDNESNIFKPNKPELEKSSTFDARVKENKPELKTQKSDF